MKEFKVLVSAIFLLSTVFGAAISARAVTIEPSAVFTLRSTQILQMDDTWGNSGFSGYLTSVSSFTDRTFVEYDLGDISGPLTDVSLSFTLKDWSLTPDTVYISVYAGDGNADTADWSAAATLYTTFVTDKNQWHEAEFSLGTADYLGDYAIDITSLINEYADEWDYLGFMFSVGSQSQLFMENSVLPSITYETESPYEPNVPTPEPSALLLLGMGMAGVIIWRSRKGRNI